ncbi:MAG: DUF1425 domain-containing protein [Opitutales bacterium]
MWDIFAKLCTRLSGALLCCLFLLAGCKTPPEPSMTEMLQQNIVIKDENLMKQLRAEALPLKNEGGQTQLQVNIHNETEVPFSIAYRLRWFDEGGYLIKDVDKRILTLPAGDFAFLQEAVEDPDQLVARYQLVIVPPPKKPSGFLAPSF